MRRRRWTRPSDAIMGAITAVAAAGDEAEVERLSALGRQEVEDRRRRATPLPTEEQP